MQDPISTLKLYPKKSNNLVTTSINTQFHVAKELVDYTLGFEISVDFYYNPATLSMSNYNAVCGRGNNSAFPSGMFLPGAFVTTAFYGKWKEGTLSQISKTGLTADHYRYRMIVTAATCQIKLLNLRTNVELSGNVAAIGTSTISEDKNFTFLCLGIDGATGAYGSVGVNYSNIKITRGSTCILNVPLSEGAGDKVTDVCNSSQYQIIFIDPALCWAKLSNYFHHNFRYGFTLYTKSASPNLYIPNTSNQSEISVTPPSGYSRVANYPECRKAFNQCENAFVLDSVSAGISHIEVTGAGTAAANGSYFQDGYLNGKPKYVSSTGNLIFFNSFWKISTAAISIYYYDNLYPNVMSPVGLVMVAYGGSLPAPTISLAAATPASDLYNADPDHVLFTENSGVAKELTIQNIDVDDGFDRGHLYINPNSQEKNLMLYKTDKTLLDDVKIIKYIGIGDEIVYDDETGAVVYDENDHTILE